MAAIPDTGGAWYAPRGVMRVLVRWVMLGGLVTVGWLLGSGTSHADEDLGQPGTDLIVNTVPFHGGPFHGGSSDRSGMSPSVSSLVKKALSSTSVPRLPVQPPVKVHVPRPILNPVGVPKPLAEVLTPVVRTLPGPAALSSPAPHHVTVQPSAPAPRPVTVLPAASALATGASQPAAAVLPPVHHAAPAMVLRVPAQPAADPLTVQPAIGDDAGPLTPMPASPPGSTTSPCMVGSAGSGTSTKIAPDIAVRDGCTTGNLAALPGLLSRDVSDLPRSLSGQPSTSPD